MAHGPRKKALHFSGNLNHVTLDIGYGIGLGLWLWLTSHDVAYPVGLCFG